MSSARIKLALLILLTGIYNYFFWDERLGLNLFIFSLLLTVILAFFNRESLKKPNALISIGFTLTAAVCVLVHNSFVSKLALFCSFFIMTSLLHEKEFRTAIAPLFHFMLTFLSTWMGIAKSFFEWLRRVSGLYGRVRTAAKTIRLLFIPLLFFFIFYFIFKIANPVFHDITREFGQDLADFIERVFKDISFVRIMFILSGAYIISSILFNWNLHDILEWESSYSDRITRIRRTVRNTAFNTVSLINEYKIALIMIIAVNLLLLVVNAIDIRLLWLNFDYAQAGRLAEMVHEGTYMLIFSILLSMAILIYYFRGNLNFLGRNKLLKIAAMVWIAQNVILAISVILRCYYYIHEHGLGYKRIGVIVFLILTFIGLFTLYRKIVMQKSKFYLARVNSWSFYAMLIALAAVNWDLVIVQYNLQHPNLNVYGKIDIGFIISRSDHALHLIDPNLDKIDFNASAKSSYDAYQIWTENKRDYVEARIINFKHQHELRSWLSWNYAEQRTFDYFSGD